MPRSVVIFSFAHPGGWMLAGGIEDRGELNNRNCVSAAPVNIEPRASRHQNLEIAAMLIELPLQIILPILVFMYFIEQNYPRITPEA